MPNIGIFHPQVVHFVVALFIVGAAFRLIGLIGREKFVNPMATTLLLLATVAAVVAARSGNDAQGPVEHIPGALAALEDHQDWGERTRNIILAVAALELLAIAFAKREKLAGRLRIGSAVVAVIGLAVLYEAAEHGGELVYSYAGGVGTRSREPEDVTRLLIAGLHNKAALERRTGNPAEAARLTEELLRLRPNDPGFRMVMVESLLQDREDPRAALDTLARISIQPGGRNLDIWKGMLAADAWEALGSPDSARAVLQPLLQRYPEIPRIQRRLDAIKPM